MRRDGKSVAVDRRRLAAYRFVAELAVTKLFVITGFDAA
jgi:hypothetical protein